MENRIREWAEPEYFGNYVYEEGAIYGPESDSIKPVMGYGAGGIGSGMGYGNGRGEGMGFSAGRGSGSGDGSGAGSGCGIGKKDGSGSGDKLGRGADYGYGVKSFKGRDVYYIDRIPTIIDHIERSVAKGAILKNDFTLEPCYVAKNGRFFAHGHTLSEAVEALNEKTYQSMDKDAVIQEFLHAFLKEKTYPGTEFFKWHNYLTGSCLMGREAFVKNHGINLEDEFTVEEFIELCKDDYGSEIIHQLRDAWNAAE